MSNPEKKAKLVKTKKVVKSKTSSLTPTKSRAKSRTAAAQNDVLIFGKKNYLYMLIGVLLIIVGMALMAGGQQATPDSWDPSSIYSFRRITLAPLLILIGFGVEIYAIFVKSE